MIEAVAEEEARLGRPMSPRERDGFARSFFAPEYVGDVRLLATAGLLDDGDEDE